jgi:low temperature requirement protein LtrA
MARVSAFTTHRSDDSRVTTLELFFDLVFVLAIAQCTALMAADPTWSGLARGLVVLGLLWWSWVGYAWLTSVVNPEWVSVRLALFGAMGGLVVAAMCVPDAWGTLAVQFTIAYGIVRAGQILLFYLASREDPDLRRSVILLGSSTTVGVSLLALGAVVDAVPQLLVWSLALALDVIGPYLGGDAGWKLAPGHFAERHGLIMIIALGETIVAIGLGATDPGASGVIASAVLGTAAACALWWVYFDVLAHVAERRLMAAESGKVRNAMARDAYSYNHLPMVAGIVLVALGLKKTLTYVHEPLAAVPAFALAGGVGLFLAGLAAFGWRTTRRIAWDTVVAAVAITCIGFAGPHVEAIQLLGIVTAALIAVVIYKALHYRDGRLRVRTHVLGAIENE